MRSIETLAEMINKKVWWFTSSAFLLLVIGFFFAEFGVNEMPHFGFMAVALGILLGGLAIFSELFTPKEEVFEGGQYLRISKVARAGGVRTVLTLIFFGLWFIGWCVAVALFTSKIYGGI